MLTAFRADPRILLWELYNEPGNSEKRTASLPLVCTEYVARPRNSRFSTIKPPLKRENVAAISWGLVEGKANTKYAWDMPLADGSEPVEWCHEVFGRDGTPYRRGETELIKKLNGK